MPCHQVSVAYDASAQYGDRPLGPLREKRTVDILTADFTCSPHPRGLTGEMMHMVHLVAMLAEPSPDEVRQLETVDFMRAVQTVRAFL